MILLTLIKKIIKKLKRKEIVSMNNENNSYNHSEMLSRVNTWISNCDAKISFALAFSGVLLGIFFTSSTIQSSLKDVLKNVMVLEIKEFFSFLAVLVLLGFIIFLALSIWYFFRGLKGTIDSSIYKQRKLEIESVLFFGTIKTMKYEDFKDKVESMNEQKLKNDYLSQIHINSTICTNKFKNYNQGITYLVRAVMCFVLLNLNFLII